MERVARFAGLVMLLVAAALIEPGSSLGAPEGPRTLVCPFFTNEPPFRTYVAMCNAAETPTYVSLIFSATDRLTGRVMEERPTYSVAIPARSIDILDSESGSSTCGRTGVTVGSVSGAIGGFQLELSGPGNLEAFRAVAYIVNTDTGDSFPVPVQAPKAGSALIGVFYNNSPPYASYLVMFNASEHPQVAEAKFWSVERMTGAGVPEAATYSVALAPGAIDIVDTSKGISSTGQRGIMVGALLGMAGGFAIQVSGPEPHLLAATSYIFDQQTGQLFSAPFQEP